MMMMDEKKTKELKFEVWVKHKKGWQWVFNWCILVNIKILMLLHLWPCISYCTCDEYVVWVNLQNCMHGIRIIIHYYFQSDKMMYVSHFTCLWNQKKWHLSFGNHNNFYVEGYANACFHACILNKPLIIPNYYFSCTVKMRKLTNFHGNQKIIFKWITFMEIIFNKSVRKYTAGSNLVSVSKWFDLIYVSEPKEQKKELCIYL